MLKQLGLRQDRHCNRPVPKEGLCVDRKRLQVPPVYQPTGSFSSGIEIGCLEDRECGPYADCSVECLGGAVVVNLTRFACRGRATFVLQVGAYQNEGTFNRAWLSQDNFKEVLALYPQETLEVTASRLPATRDEFKADFEQNSHGNKKLA